MRKTVVPFRRPGRPAFEQADKPAAERFRDACRHISISRDGRVPLWLQICEQLEGIIQKGDIEPHSRMPSEETLAEMFGVSRPVIRKALQTLASRGLVVKIHRKGVFVGAPPMQTDFLTKHLSVYDDMVSRGHKVVTNTFLLERTAPDDDERDALQLGSDDTVIRIERVFWLNGKAIVYAHISLHGGKLPGFENLDIENRSLLGVVRERYGLRLCRAERWFKAAIAPPDVSTVMEIEAGSPLILIESIAQDAENTPLEYYRAYYNSEVARMHLLITD